MRQEITNEIEPASPAQLAKESLLKHLKPSVYAQGWRRTEVARPVAVWLSALFCAGLLAVPLADALLGSWDKPFSRAKAGLPGIAKSFGGGLSWDGVVRANRSALQTIESFEDSLEDSSALGAAVRPPVLDGLLVLGGAGSEEAYVGREGWLFYRPDVDALVLHGAEENLAAEGIAHFASELAARGIRLVVVPVPGKASIHPEMLAPVGAIVSAPPLPPTLSSLAAAANEAWKKKHGSNGSTGPLVADPARLLWSRKKDEEDQFLRTDSHWTPAAMRSTAEMVAAAAALLPQGGKENFTVQKQTISATGDTALMQSLPAESALLQKQTVEIEKVATADGTPWSPDRDSPVLVLGDSYTNIYSSRELGWGESAGFAEHLSRALGCRVDKLARNDAGAKSAREMLAAEAARNPQWLNGKKVVVWVMAAREFVRGDWSPVTLSSETAETGTEFMAVAPGQNLEVEATIRALGPLPSSGDTPYADYLTALHLADLREVSRDRAIPGEALAYIFTMRDRKPLPSPQLFEGNRVKLRLSNYRQKADKLDSLNRGELDDVEVMMQEPNYAEWIGSP